MLNYEKMFEPYTSAGATLPGSISWLKKITGADQAIIDQAIAETMDRVSDGESFPRPCRCGCGGNPDNVHTPINHYMLRTVQRLQVTIVAAQSKIIQDRQKKLVEHQLKKLSNFEKEYDKMINGTWAQNNLPTFRRWLGIK